MEFFVFLTLTAFAVSVDSMVAGFAIGLKTKKTWFFALIVAVATFLLCTLATLLAILATEQYNVVFKITGALFLIVIGIANFVKRHEEMPEGSYTTSLFQKGVAKMSQKVGEEAVETVIEAMANNNSRLIYEASDLLYHLIVLLTSKGLSIEDLAADLKKRHKVTKDEYPNQ